MTQIKNKAKTREGYRDNKKDRRKKCEGKVGYGRKRSTGT